MTTLAESITAFSGSTSLNTNIGVVNAVIPDIVLMQAVVTSLVLTTTSLETAAINSLTGLETGFPLMKAVLLLDKKIEMAEGGTSGTDGSTDFNNYFAAITSTPALMQPLADALVAASLVLINILTGVTGAGLPGVTGTTPTAVRASYLAHVAGFTSPDFDAYVADNAAVFTVANAQVASMIALITTATSTINAAIATKNAAYTSGTNKLKAMAFATFCASPQPVALASVVSQVISPTYIPDLSKLATASAATNRWLSAQVSKYPQGVADNTFIISPPTLSTSFVATTTDPDDITAIQTQYFTSRDTVETNRLAYEIVLKTFSNYEVSSGYATIYNAREEGPTQYQAYITAKAVLHSSSEYLAAQSAKAVYDVSVLEKDKLFKIYSYMLNTGPWPGNPSGPW